MDWKRDFRKNNFGAVLGKSKQSFRLWYFCLKASHIVLLATKIGEGGGFVKMDRKRVFRKKNDFSAVLGKSERSFCAWQFFLETRHIVHLASKIGEGGGSVKMDQKRAFRRNNFRQKRANFLSVTIFPQNVPYNPFGPGNRWWGQFRKNRPEMCFSEKQF